MTLGTVGEHLEGLLQSWPKLCPSARVICVRYNSVDQLRGEGGGSVHCTYVLHVCVCVGGCECVWVCVGGCGCECVWVGGCVGGGDTLSEAN